MTPAELRARTAEFARQAADVTRPLLRSIDSQDAARQLRRAAASTAANYRAAGRSRSPAEFVSRLAVVVEEADESLFWVEHLRATGGSSAEVVVSLLDEAQQLVAIFGRSLQTARRNAAQSRTAK